ncbi:MAG: tetratricopeptide repeat protein [Acidobacteriaceae bacterium]
MTKVRVAEGKHLPPFGWREVAVLGAAVVFSTTVFAQSSSTPGGSGSGVSKTPASSSNGAQNGQAASMPPATANAAVPKTGATGKRAQSYYHFALGHLYEQSAEQYGRPELATQAVEQYKLALSGDPDSVFLQNSLADTYFNLGRIREAIETAQQILKNHPNNLTAHKLLGRVYLRSLGDTAAGQQPGPMLGMAIQEFQKIVELEPNKVDDHLLLGQLYTLKHDTAAAKAQFEDANRIDPESEDVVLNLARLYGEQGDMKQAVAVLERVPPDQRSPKIDMALGAIYDQLKETKPAIAAYQAALNSQPDNLDAQRGLAEDLLSANQPDAALKIFQGITAEDPGDSHSFVRLAELERTEGHLDKAKEALAHARDIDPNSVEVQYNEAMVAESQGDLNQAATILRQLADSTAHANGQYSADEKNNRAIFLDRLATVYRDQNKVDPAIAVYKEMIALGGADGERGYQGEVDAYRDAKMLPQATAAAQQAVQALPKNIDMQLTLAGQLADTGHPKEGVALAKSQLNGSKQDRIVWLTLAQMDTRLHKWKDASAAIDQAEKLSTTKQQQALIHFLRGALHERQKHIDAAERQFRQALALDPNNALALNYLGYMLADHDLKLNEALQLVQRAVQLDPENGAYLDSLGWVHYKLGQYGMAEQVLEKAITLIPTDPTVHDHLGEVYASRGQLQQAVAQWESSLANYANSAPADAEPADVNKVRKRLDKARVKLVKEDAHTPAPRQP